MRLLRTILLNPNCHLLNPNRIFSSLLSHSFSAETNESDNQRNQPSSWSNYGDVFDTSLDPQRHSDHSDDEKASEKMKKVQAQAQGLGGTGNIIGTKRKGKVKSQWVCCNCGHTSGQWWGTCPSCDIVGTMKEFHEAKLTDADNKPRTGLAVSEDAMGLWLPQRAGELRPMKLEEVNSGFDHLRWRIPLSGPFGNEVSMVLGGGLVPGSLTLVGGDPGVGKSTLLLQIAATIGEGCTDGEASPVVYVSGEESLQQIGHRAERLGIKSNINLYSSTDIEDILKKAHCLYPRALVIDSIQTVYLKGIMGSAGGIMQVKECTSALMRFAKTTNIPVLLIGHVTKSGEIAGPRVLEHIVDAVLYMEGERYSTYRMLRAVKNRFGSTDEVCFFYYVKDLLCLP
ncbi:uncharacterized protein LOC133309982 isoform X2 [Gastrolobium bilobum]|uniref:uncharacterized protein LOC133309982 isoform X2 n=2 Tax=Gastrolobium bilobum TaxID=150636 RepID=UPI002AB0A8F2|nr:uncharacterized protein LOC133309982 isoform X2 [Gastrolobium bilobum]